MHNTRQTIIIQRNTSWLLITIYLYDWIWDGVATASANIRMRCGEEEIAIRQESIIQAVSQLKAYTCTIEAEGI